MAEGRGLLLLADGRGHNEVVRHERVDDLSNQQGPVVAPGQGPHDIASLEDADKKNAADIQAEARKREQELKELIGQFNDLKSDMPLVYTLREDFIRSMNSVDHNISGITAVIWMTSMGPSLLSDSSADALLQLGLADAVHQGPRECNIGVGLLLCTLVVGALTYFFKKTLTSLEDADKKNAADIQAEARKREQSTRAPGSVI